MKPGDPEPLTSRSLGVLKNAVYEYRTEQYLHPDPRLAVEQMKTTYLANVIHEIGLSPFFVISWALRGVSTLFGRKSVLFLEIFFGECI